MKTPARISLLSILMLAGCPSSSPQPPYGYTGSAGGGFTDGGAGGTGGSSLCRDVSTGIVPDGNQVVDTYGTTVADVLATIEGAHHGSLTWAVGADVSASVVNGDRTSAELDVVPDPQQIRYFSPDAGASPCLGALTIGSTVRFVTGDGSFNETLTVTWGDEGRLPGAFSLGIDLPKIQGTLKVAPRSTSTFTLGKLGLEGTCGKSCAGCASTCTGAIEVSSLSDGVSSGAPKLAGLWSVAWVSGGDGGSPDGSGADSSPTAD